MYNLKEMAPPLSDLSVLRTHQSLTCFLKGSSNTMRLWVGVILRSDGGQGGVEKQKTEGFERKGKGSKKEEGAKKQERGEEENKCGKKS